jgi:hypothetical protein
MPITAARRIYPPTAVRPIPTAWAITHSLRKRTSGVELNEPCASAISRRASDLPCWNRREGPCPFQTAGNGTRFTLSTAWLPSIGTGGRFASNGVVAFPPHLPVLQKFPANREFIREFSIPAASIRRAREPAAKFRSRCAPFTMSNSQFTHQIHQPQQASWGSGIAYRRRLVTNTCPNVFRSGMIGPLGLRATATARGGGTRSGGCFAIHSRYCVVAST